MNQIVLIIRKDGSIISLPTWQKEYGIQTGYVGKYFKIGEPGFKDETIHVSELLIRLLDEYRELRFKKIGKATKINSLFRSHQKQQDLIAAGYRAAQYSPHEEAMAADVDTDNENDTKASLPLMRQAAANLNIKARIGWKKYMQDGNSFIHVDVCPEYFAPGKPFHHKKHPIQWETAFEF